MFEFKVMEVLGKGMPPGGCPVVILGKERGVCCV